MNSVGSARTLLLARHLGEASNRVSAAMSQKPEIAHRIVHVSETNQAMTQMQCAWVNSAETGQLGSRGELRSGCEYREVRLP